MRGLGKFLQLTGLCLWALSPSPQGAVYNWIQTNAGTFNWSDTANWDVAGFPNAAGDEVFITNFLLGDQTIQISGNHTLGALTLGSISAPGREFTLLSNGNGSLHFSNSSGPAAICKAAGQANLADALSVPILLGSDLWISNQTAGALQFNSLIQENGPRSVTVVSSTGTGWVVFYKTNNWSGNTRIMAGAVVAGNICHGPTNAPTSGPLGTGTVFLEGGWARASVLYSTLALLNPVQVLSNTYFNTSTTETTLEYAGNATLVGGHRTLTVDTGSTVPDMAIKFTGNIGDGGNGYRLTKAGKGNLWLTGSNTYGGGTLISAGSLWVSNAAGESNVFALGTGAVTNNSTLVLTATNGRTLTCSGMYDSLNGTGTNVVLRPSLGSNSATFIASTNAAGFSGTWFIGPDAVAGGGKVAIQGGYHPSVTYHIYTNATMYFNMNGPYKGTAWLYGGDTGESLGQLRVEGGHNWTGTVWIAGPMTAPGDGHLGSHNNPGGISGTVREAVPGAWPIRKSGRTNLVLSGTNSFTGNLVILDGSISVGAPSMSSGAGPLGSNATVTLTNDASVMLDLNGYDARLGHLLGGGNVGGAVLLGTNTLTLGAPDGTDSVYEGAISGVGRVVKVGTNVQFLVGTNTYSGGTLLSNGVLGVGSNSTLGTGLVQIFPTATHLRLTNGTRFTNDITIYGGGVGNSGHGVIDMAYPGTAYLTNGVILILGGTSAGGHLAGSLVVDGTLMTTNQTTVTHRSGSALYRGTANYGELDIGFGTVRLGKDNAIPAAAKVSIGWATLGGPDFSYLDLGGFNQALVGISNAGGLSNTPVIGNSSTGTDSTLTLTGTSFYFGVLKDRISSGTRKLNLILAGGNLTATGTNTYSGTTVVSGGTFRAGATAVPGQGGAFGSNSAVTLSNTAGTVMDLNGFDQAVGSLAGGGSSGGHVALGSGTLTIGADHSTTSYDGVIGGTGGVVKAGSGTLTLTGAHTYSGPTLITNGILVLDGSLAAASVVTVSNGGSLAGSGTAYGVVTVGSGGTVAPGLPGTNAAVFGVGSATFLAGSKYVIDLDGATPTNDLLTATGAVVCGGNLVATNVTNSTNESIYVVIQASNVTGNFSGIPDNGFLYQKGRLFQVRYTSTNVTLRDIGDFAPPPELEVTNPGPLSYWNGSNPISGVSTNQDPTLANPAVFAMTNGGAWISLGATNEWCFLISVSNLNEGTHGYSFMAYLSNGLTNRIWYTNIVDKTAPGVPSISGGANPFINQTSVTLGATDNFSLDRIFYTTDGSVPDANALSVASGGAVTLTNACTLTAIARDMAGNWGATNAVVFGKVPNPVGVGSIGAITPNPYRPGNGVLTVSYQRQNLERLGMFLFDIQGRQVAEMKAVTDGALYRVDFLWDGKTASGQVAGRGMYLVIPKVGADLRSDLARRVYLP